MSTAIERIDEIIDGFQHSLMQASSLGKKDAAWKRNSGIVEAQKLKADLEIERAENMTLLASEKQNNGEYYTAAKRYYEAVEGYNSALKSVEEPSEKQQIRERIRETENSIEALRQNEDAFGDVCLNCNGTLPENSRFCPHCGVEPSDVDISELFEDS